MNIRDDAQDAIARISAGGIYVTVHHEVERIEVPLLARMAHRACRTWWRVEVQFYGDVPEYLLHLPRGLSAGRHFGPYLASFHRTMDICGDGMNEMEILCNDDESVRQTLRSLARAAFKGTLRNFRLPNPRPFSPRHFEDLIRAPLTGKPWQGYDLRAA